MDRDSLHFGKIVFSNGAREPGGLVFHLWGVEWGPAVLSQIVWTVIDPPLRDASYALPPEYMDDQFAKTVGAGRHAAVCLTATLQPDDSFAEYDRTGGPVSCVVIDLWVDPKLSDGGPTLTFPGSYQIADALRTMYPKDGPDTRVAPTEVKPDEITLEEWKAAISARGREDHPAG